MFGRAVSGLNVNEPKLSSVLTLRVEIKNENVRFVVMFKQTHDNKFNGKWFIRRLKGNTFLYLIFTEHQKFELVAENKNNALSVPRLVKV